MGVPAAIKALNLHSGLVSDRTSGVGGDFNHGKLYIRAIGEGDRQGQVAAPAYIKMLISKINQIGLIFD